MALPHSDSELLFRLLNGLAGRNASDPRPLNFLASESPAAQLRRESHIQSNAMLDEVRRLSTSLEATQDVVRDQVVVTALVGKIVAQGLQERPSRAPKWESNEVRELKERAREEFESASYAEDFSAHV